VEATVGSSVGVEIQRKKLDVLKTKLADENRKLTRLKDAAKRKRELEKINRPGPRR
jgi:hypothetical protein